MSDQQDNDRVPIRSSLGVSSIGIEFVVPVVVLAAVGYYLDDYLSTAPWIMFAMGVLGMVVGTWSVWRAAKALMEAEDRKK